MEGDYLDMEVYDLADSDSDSDSGSHAGLGSGPNSGDSEPSDSESDDIPAGPLSFDEDHPNMHVPWGMKEYPADIIEAWTMVHNYAMTGSASGQDMDVYLSKLSKEVLDQPNHDCQTLLYMACFSGYAHIAEDLLKAGATPNIGDTYFERSPLMIAVQNTNVECVEKLLEHVDVNEKDSSGFSAIFHAARCGLDEAMKEFLECEHKENMKIMRPRNKIILKMLIDKGADVNCASSIGMTPLHAAVGNDNVAAVQILLEHGADPLAEYRDITYTAPKLPMNALDKAAYMGYNECVDAILEKCISNKALLSRSNAMRFAVQYGHLACTKCFINAGVDADMGVKLPPDELAVYRVSEDACPLLAHIDTISVELVKYLLSNGASPLNHNVPFRTPLDKCPMYVAFLKSGEVLQLLLKHCAELDGDGHYRGNRNPDFPVGDMKVWWQPVSRFRTMLQAGFSLGLEQAPLQGIRNSGYDGTLQEVVRIWARLTDKLTRNLNLPEGLACYEEVPQSLSDLSRIAVRRAIGFPRLAKPSSVEQLPIPQHLRDYLSKV